VTGTTIIPGLINVRDDVPIDAGPSGTSVPLAANLAFGVTTVQLFLNADAIEAAHAPGRMVSETSPGARIIAAGVVTADRQGALNSLAAVRALVARYQALGVTALSQDGALSRDQQQWLGTAANEAGLVLSGESGNLRHALTLVIDGYHTLQGTIPNAQLYDDVRKLLVAAHTVYVPTLLRATGGDGTAEEYFVETTDVRNDPVLRRFGLADPRRMGEAKWRWLEDYHFLAVSEQAALLRQRGVPVVAGTAGQRPGVGLHWELWALAQRGAQHGLSAHDALRAATATAAATLGVAHALGTIEVGKIADLVVLAGNPLMDLRESRTTRYVMRDGVLFDATTLAGLWPRPAAPPALRDTQYDPPSVAAQSAARFQESQQ